MNLQVSQHPSFPWDGELRLPTQAVIPQKEQSVRWEWGGGEALLGAPFFPAGGLCLLSWPFFLVSALTPDLC